MSTTTTKTEAFDPKDGMRLGELRKVLAAVTDMPDTARIKVRVGYSAQLRSIEIIDSIREEDQ